jgi:hypothetical protein
VQNWLKMRPKNYVSDGIKKNTLEPVRWSHGGLRWKVILVSFLYMFNKCAFFNSPFTFGFTLVCILNTHRHTLTYVYVSVS